LARDEIENEPPLGLIGQLAAPFIIVPRFKRMFEYRHCVTRKKLNQVTNL
jgi:ligand-binding SRPBCC domain-containing protein